MGRSGLTNLCVLHRCKLSLYHGREVFGSPKMARILHSSRAAQDGSKKMILITGSSGSVGKTVLQEAIRKESKVRGMYRSKDEAAKAPDGVNSVYVVCSPIPQLVELESNIVDACKEAGVKHVVLNSALGAGDYGKSYPGWHRKVEDKLKGTWKSYTILRPNG